ncbi:MAG: hypothetical protein SFY80_10130 [Verrucomicrobiota bacterium]|nr:hypothetical protein [Verrucomicrobiota bacterium]
MIRLDLQAGKGRQLACGALFCIATGGLFCGWDMLKASDVDVLKDGQKVAFIAAAFSVTAYNLRTRVIDLILKVEARPTKIQSLCAVARDCGQRLTNLVLLFTGTALLMALMGFLKADYGPSKWIAALVAGLFFGSFVQFIYILFAFERLERFMLDDAEERAKDRDAKRLLG